MYKLYSKKGTCSRAINALLNALEQKFELIDASKIENYKSINPTGAVPFLIDGQIQIQEGAAIATYLMDKHNSPMLPKDNLQQRANALQWMMFANATVHPTYSRMLFFMKNGKDQNMMNLTAKRINELWKIADDQLAKTKFMAGDGMTMADIFLTVYAGWNSYFGDSIILGNNVTRMVKETSSSAAFQKAAELEK